MPAKIHKGFFTKVKVARELLREKAEQIIEEYLEIAQKAKDAGDYETAAKQLQWLIEHMPEDAADEGRLVGTSVDKAKPQVEKPTGPSIQIGIALGGVGGQQKALPEAKAEVIDAE